MRWPGGGRSYRGLLLRKKELTSDLQEGDAFIIRGTRPVQRAACSVQQEIEGVGRKAVVGCKSRALPGLRASSGLFGYRTKYEVDL